MDGPAKGRRRQSGSETRRPRDGKLSKETIVLAALAEIADVGGSALTIRGVARRLGVFPTAIYWHITSFQHLVSEVVSHVMRGVLPEDPALSWQEFLRQYFARRRAAIRDNPGVIGMILGRIAPRPQVTWPDIERILGVLRSAGFTGRDLVAAYNTVFVSGACFATQEYADPPSRDDPNWAREVEAAIENMSARDYPVFHENRRHLANRAFGVRWQGGGKNPLDDSFEAYVDVIVLGLERRLERLKSSKKASTKPR